MGCKGDRRIYSVVSMPTLTTPNGSAAPGKTLPPLYDVPGTVPWVPMKGLTNVVQSVVLVFCAPVRLMSRHNTAKATLRDSGSMTKRDDFLYCSSLG